MWKSFFLVVFFSIGMVSIYAQGRLIWTEELSAVMRAENDWIADFSTQQKLRPAQSYFSFFQAPASIEEGPFFAADKTKDPLGIFCTLDLNLDQKLPFKLRFRLGEYHYTHQLEYGLSEN